MISPSKFCARSLIRAGCVPVSHGSLLAHEINFISADVASGGDYHVSPRKLENQILFWA
jgi:hypothetical protein